MDRAVTVRMFDMRWFFNNDKNFMTFTKLLKGVPSKVYSSLFIKCLLDQFWAPIQKKIIQRQFIPYCAFVVTTIAYFNLVLQQ